MIRFHLPDFCYLKDLNLAICELFQSNKEVFINGMKIGSIYGSFPCYWNGGRPLLEESSNLSLRDMELSIASFNNLGIPVRFTFTNSLIDEHLIHDPRCNLFMQMADNGMNEVLVNSPVLEEYLRNEYPNFKYISSTTKCLTYIDAVNAECKKYDLVVLDYRKNHDDSFIEKLEDKSKIEILCNAYCPPTCGQRKTHYLYESYFNLYTKNNPVDFKGCSISYRNFWEAINSPVAVLNDDKEVKYTLSYYESLGINNFKIEGRCGPHFADVLDSYMYYLIKKEYRDYVRNMILRKFEILPH